MSSRRIDERGLVHVLRLTRLSGAARWLLRASTHVEAAHFGVSLFEDGLVLCVCYGGFLAIAAREAAVDFLVEGAADGFADALDWRC